MSQSEKFTAIANAIRNVEGRSNYKIAAKDFHTDIGKLDPKMNSYHANFENGYYGLRAVKCASTYLFARVFGTDKFTYSNTTLFGNKNNPSNPIVRYGEYGGIDCSTFVGLCLRGIPYEKSPYALHKNLDATWNPKTELPGMYGAEGWEFRQLDSQPKSVFNNIGISGCTTIRYAADFGRFFYKYGRVLYEQSVDGVITDHSVIGLEPGDLVFWDTGDNNSNSRFKSISHIALVAENTSYYYQATGTEGRFDQNVIMLSPFANEDTIHPTSKLVLAIRPDYRPHLPKEKTPIGVNLLEYPWTYSRGKTYSKNGLTVTLVDKHTINVSGTPSTRTLFDLKSSANGEDHLTLSAGSYQLSGIQGFTGIAFALQVRDAAENDFATPVRYPTDNNSTNTFTLTEETDVTVRLYASDVLGEINTNVTPTLIRTA